MAILGQYRKLQVTDIAHLLGIHPFDVVRILACHNYLVPSMRYEPEIIERVRSLGGIETWWTESNPIDQDPVRPRAVLRSLARELLVRKFVGSRTSRVDNVFRGLPAEDDLIARKALNLLVQEHLVRTVPTAIGTHVSVIPEALPVMESIAEGREIPAGLAALWLV